MSDAKVDNLDMNQIKEIISSKENEIKDILMKKIISHFADDMREK